MDSFWIWYFVLVPQKLFRVVRGTLYNLYHFFSIPFLLSTLFEPWKRDVSYAPNLSLNERVILLGQNLISRLVGALVRVATIIAGLFVTGVALLGGVGVLIFWYLLPLIIAALLYSSLTYL